MGTTAVIIGIVCLLVGVAAGYFLGNKSSEKELDKAKVQAESIVKEATIKGDSIVSEKLTKARTKMNEQKSSFDSENRKRNQRLAQNEDRLKKREAQLNKRGDGLKKEQTRLDSERDLIASQKEMIAKKKKALDDLKEKEVEALEKISNISAEEATNQLMKTLEDEARSRSKQTMKDMVAEAKETATKEAKKIVIQTIQRTAAEHAIENTVSVFNLANDEIKGRIIGREGRNIRALEAATGIEIIVDDTPEAIILSGFDPVRREVARLALHRLVQDGRIHPARIEEVVNKTRNLIEQQIKETGERTALELGVHGLHPELIKMIGRMRYRSSYGQNLLQHSREVARLCATMASELGLNTKKALRAGLLHDIGKVPEEEPELPHALLGMKMAQKYKEDPEVCNAIGAHHDEIEMTSMISPIIQACDAISGSRPGARREVVENYIKRLKELEAIALAHPGVVKSYAIQAGRELRVIVESEKVSDDKADTLAFDISQQIMDEMQYPGQIKITVIREKRAVAFAK